MSELIEGTDGNDTLTGALVFAGRGDDWINGVVGAETVLIYAPGDGNDVLSPAVVSYPGSKRPPNYDGNTVVRFTEGIEPKDLVATSRVVENSMWHVETTLSFKNQPGGIRAINLVRIEFADGTQWDRSLIDIFISTGLLPDSDMYIDRRDAADTRSFLLGAGADTFLGGVTDDTVSGGDGDDSLDGGIGRDVLQAGAGNDTLAGGAHDDELVGGAGADTFIFNAGDGNDTLVADATDTLLLGPGLTRDSVYAASYYNRDGQNVGVTMLFEGQLNTVINLTSAAALDPADGIPDVIRFADGSTLTRQALLDMVANPRPLRIEGSSGMDYLYGLAANDTLLGLEDSDYLIGGGGDDLLMGGAGNDDLNGNAGHDTLQGGRGDDWIEATEGADTVLFNAGDGQDYIVLGNEATLVLGPGLTRSQARLSMGQDLSGFPWVDLGFAGSADLIHLPVRSGMTEGTVRFADGVTLRFSDLLELALHPTQTLTGTAGRDTLTGGAGRDTLSGLAGNDMLLGEGGDDLLDGGAGIDLLIGGQGDDTLMGGKGNDVYRYTRGDGLDTIIDNDSTWFNRDVLQLTGAATNQLWFTRSGNNLNIAILGTQDKVTVQDWFKGSSYRVEKITAMDSGNSLTASKVNSLVTAMAGFSLDPASTPQLPANTPGNITRLIASSWA